MNKATIDLVKKYEGLHDGDLRAIGLQPKLCPAGIWTEGYGRIIIDPETRKPLKGKQNYDYAVAISTIKTEAQAEAALIKDLEIHAICAEKFLTTKYWSKLNENQKGALTSFVYNCGPVNAATKKPYRIFETIIDFLNDEITAEILINYWKISVICGGGKVLKGLQLRREDEAKLFFTT